MTKTYDEDYKTLNSRLHQSHVLQHQTSHISDENDDYQNLFSSFDNTIVNLDDACLHGLVSHDVMSIEDESTQQQHSVDHSLNTLLHSQRQHTPNPLSNQNMIMPLHSPASLTSSAGNVVAGASSSSLLVDDDQDKKIKTLADNIIAAMPHKIKMNSYSTGVSQQQQTMKNFSNNSTRANSFFDPGNSYLKCL